MEAEEAPDKDPVFAWAEHTEADRKVLETAYDYAMDEDRFETDFLGFIAQEILGDPDGKGCRLIGDKAAASGVIQTATERSIRTYLYFKK